ncbi:MAG: GNAT family N-acetyltransferase [Chloroflexia bacterium]
MNDTLNTVMKVEPVTLEGRLVRLEPLSEGHIAGLYEVAAPEIFIYMFGGPVSGFNREEFREYLRELRRRPAFLPFVTVLRETGKPIGITCYLDIRPEHRGLEIGHTWIALAHQGTRVNPECKYLLLRHAFETLGAIRVQLKTDGRNIHSQKAIAKLGAKWEGTLRKQVIMQDGYVRDTVMFSIIEEEWPAIKAGLEVRLGYAP